MKIGIIGLGTVGEGVLKVLTTERKSIFEKSTMDIEVKYACDLNINREFSFDFDKSILIDDARGEAEHLSCMHIAENQNPITLKWVIPIYYSEAKFILENGIDEFDILESKNELSLADITRAPVV